MSYFLGFFFSLLLASGSALGGLPTLFLSLIASSVSGGYSASRVSGLMPALCMRRSIVLCGTPSSRAISVNVNPVIATIIGIISENVNRLNRATVAIHTLSRKRKKANIFSRLLQKGLDKMFEICDNISIDNEQAA